MHLHYTDAYHKLISAGGENSPVRWRERKATLRQYKQSGALLDLGCSSGAFLESLKGEPWKLYGIEMSAEGARTGRWTLEPTLVRRGASIGSGAVILCGLTIGEGARIGAGAVVTHDVAPGLEVVGVPARAFMRSPR